MFHDDLNEFEPERPEKKKPSPEEFLNDMMAEAMRLLMRNYEIRAIHDSKVNEDVLRQP